jgi:large subunit ribosomal protein L29
MSRASELRELDDRELADKLNESKDELFRLRFQVATGQQENTARLGQVRREIARLNTLQRAREIDAAKVTEVNR